MSEDDKGLLLIAYCWTALLVFLGVTFWIGL